MTVYEWSNHIRGEIMAKTGCPCSTGFGANRLQARLATRKAKPAGQYYLSPEDLEEYMCDVPLVDLPGVGRATIHKLKTIGLKTCGDVLVCFIKTYNFSSLFIVNAIFAIIHHTNSAVKSRKYNIVKFYNFICSTLLIVCKCMFSST